MGRYFSEARALGGVVTGGLLGPHLLVPFVAVGPEQSSCQRSIEPKSNELWSTQRNPQALGTGASTEFSSEFVVAVA
jgi:hypothetical protein